MKQKLLMTGIGLLVIVLACGAYLGDYYHADLAAVEAFSAEAGAEPYT